MWEYKMLPWVIRQKIRTFVRSSMWLIPLCCTVLALIAAPVIRWVDDNTHWTLLSFDAEGARALLASFIAATLSYMVFIASALLIALQLMSASLSPRVIREFMVAWSYRIVLGLFVFTFIFSVAALARTSGEVRQLTIFVAVFLNLVSIGAFLYLVDYVMRNFRPSAIVNRISRQGLQVIEQCYTLPSISAEQ